MKLLIPTVSVTVLSPEDHQKGGDSSSCGDFGSLKPAPCWVAFEIWVAFQIWLASVISPPHKGHKKKIIRLISIISAVLT